VDLVDLVQRPWSMLHGSRPVWVERRKARQSSIGAAYRRHSKELFQPLLYFADVWATEDSSKESVRIGDWTQRAGSRIDVGKTPIRHEGVSA
jgi:hypothetical protein